MKRSKLIDEKVEISILYMNKEPFFKGYVNSRTTATLATFPQTARYIYECEYVPMRLMYFENLYLVYSH